MTVDSRISSHYCGVFVPIVFKRQTVGSHLIQMETASDFKKRNNVSTFSEHHCLFRAKVTNFLHEQKVDQSFNQITLKCLVD